MTATFAASPRGARVGFCTAGSSHSQITLTVAPKAWRGYDAPRVTVLQTLSEDRRHDVVLYETDRLQVIESPRYEAILTACARQSSHIEGSRDFGESLLAMDAPPARTPTPSDPKPLHGDATTDLMLLLDNLNMLPTTSEALAAMPFQSPLHRPLMYRRFLDEVLHRLGSARRAYRPVTAVRVSVRGRVDPVTVARYQRNGDPRLTCRYDEFTQSTLLLGIICAALEWVAEGNSIRSPFDNRFSNVMLRNDAVGLRRALGEVSTIPIAKALTDGPRLRLNRLDLPWAEALQLAMAILRGHEYLAATSPLTMTNPVELSVRTDKLWERVVHELVHRLGFDCIRDQRHLNSRIVADPWITTASAPRTYPDAIAKDDSGLWVIDAKYKFRGDSSLPSRTDQYQLFAYSHLVRDGDTPVRHALLIYSGTADSRTWPRGRDDAVDLTACSVPFPSPAEVRSRASWNRYLARSSQILGEVIDATSGHNVVY